MAGTSGGLAASGPTRGVALRKGAGPRDSAPDALLIALLSAASLLSAAWLVLHARDVALLLRPVFPLVPGEGRRLASFWAVSAAITLFGFSMVGELWIVLRAAGLWPW